MFRSRSDQEGGGVSFLISKDIKFILRPEPSYTYDFIECIFIEVPQSRNLNILLGSVYRPPNTDVRKFNAEHHKS